MTDTKRSIQLGHSPDPDDAFMFYGLANGAVDSEGYDFEHILKDIQTLNEWAKTGKLEITAISVHTYPYVQDQYAILSSGASMGATELATYEYDTPFEIASPPTAKTGVHGPLVVAKEPMPLESLKGKKIGIPGTMTSAFLELQLAIGKFDYEVIMFDEIPQAVVDGKVDAGLLIHEGQLTFGQMGLHCLLDLGQWWYDKTGLPLPLGCNVIRRDLGEEVMTKISHILKKSILYSLENREEAVKYALEFGRGLDLGLASQFVGLYVNEWTVDYGPAGRKAIAELLKQGHAAGIVPEVKDLRFV